MTAFLLATDAETAEAPRTRRSVTLLSGFLGSGKTTLLRSALATTAAEAAPLVVLNDVADSFADELLLGSDERDAVLLSGGCVCCTRLDALLDVLKRHLDEEPAGPRAVRHVVIETSGLSDPGPIALAIATDPMLRHHYEVARICVTLDVLHGLQTLAEHEVGLRQLVAADEVIVTKADLAEAREVERVCDRVQALNPSATVTVSARGRRVQVISPSGPLLTPGVTTGGSVRHGDVATLEFTADRPLDWQAFSVWLSLLVHGHGDKVLRVKGSLDVDGVGYVSINAVRDVIHAPEHVAPTASPGSRLVCIVQGVAPDLIRTSFDTFMETK